MKNKENTVNKDNFKKLIDAINFDGKAKFNMQCFIGKLSLDSEHFESSIINGTDAASDFTARQLDWVETTDLFNCNSVGCIAGFATALANDWKTPEWIKPTTYDKQLFQGYQNWAPDFEKEANQFLGLSRGQGNKLYYNTDDCVWKYLRYYEPDRYPDLDYINSDDCDIDNFDWDDSDLEIDFSTIDYKTAVDVLTRIMNEEIILGEYGADIKINERKMQ